MAELQTYRALKTTRTIVKYEQPVSGMGAACADAKPASVAL